MPLFERSSAAGSSIDETISTFSIDEVAEAAGVPAEEAWRAVDLGQAVVYGKGLVSAEDAAHLVRLLTGIAPLDANRTPISLKREPKGKGRFRLAAAGILYTLGAALLILMSSMGLLSVTSTDEAITEPEQIRLVYLMSAGPGGGGGGGGLLAPLPPPPAQRKSPTPKKAASPVPLAKPQPAPPIPTPTPAPAVKVVQTIVDTPKPTPAPAVQAPFRMIAADPVDTIGLPVMKEVARPPSQGRGTLGGVGSGSGQGIGEGTGGGLGPGTGGGTGGGPYQPGAGIDPPMLVREVRPIYTDEARRQSIEGDVLLEIVVLHDGTVGNVRVRRSLPAGLEQKAIDAVRQWKFSPARRHGTAVDVVVDVAVEFKLR